MSEAEESRAEWGLRDDVGGQVRLCETEEQARWLVAYQTDLGREVSLVRRIVTVGRWKSEQ